ncbi:MAG TPA: thiamine phosphate synthase [Roseiarcus sp.]|nr:thiamine phosphate synthase [Roseiarcus sp.]
MPLTPQASPRSSLYLVTPPYRPLTPTPSSRFSCACSRPRRIACALVRLAPGSESHTEAIMAPLLRPARDADCALLIENDARSADRLGADGVHVAGAGADLAAAIKRLKPERIVGAGSLRTRD